MSDLILHLGERALVIGPFPGNAFFEACVVLARPLPDGIGLVEEPPPGLLTRQACFRKIMFERLTCSELLSELRFEFRLPLRGSEPFGRRALFAVPQRGFGIGQPAVERIPGLDGFCERGAELRFAPRESFGGGGLRRTALLRLLERRLQVREFRFERAPRGGFLTELRLKLGLTLRGLLLRGGGLQRSVSARLFERCRGFTQLAGECVAGCSDLRQPCVVLDFTLGEVRRSRLALRRIPLLGVLTRCFRFCQLPLERLARGG